MRRPRFQLGHHAALVQKSPKVTEVLPLLYLHGLSTGDFVRARGVLRFCGWVLGFVIAGSSRPGRTSTVPFIAPGLRRS